MAENMTHQSMRKGPSSPDAPQTCVLTRHNREQSGAIARFAKTASHDLRQPVAALRLLLEQLPHLSDEDERQSVLSIALQSVDLLHSQLETMVLASQLAGGLHKAADNAVDTAELTATIAEGITAKLQTGVMFHVECPAIRLQTDSDLLHTLLTQLVANAAEFTTSGTVCLAVEKKEKEGLFRITDTGPGIAADELVRLGGAFWQGTPDQKSFQSGLGLGLFIAIETANLLGTELILTTQRGQGTTVEFAIPLASD